MIFSIYPYGRCAASRLWGTLEARWSLLSRQHLHRQRRMTGLNMSDLKMIKLSELAASVLLESLQASGVGPDRGLRLKVERGRFVLRLDYPGQNDRVIQHNGAVVLIIAQDEEARVGEARIDIEEGPNGAELTIRRAVLG